jgi:hypothetical protein
VDTEFLALALEMADELDHGRQCLMDDRSLTHPLADRARAALAAEPGQGVSVTPDDFRQWWRETGSASPAPSPEMLLTANAWANHCLTRYGTRPAPVPVTERLPELRRTFDQTLNWARCLEPRSVGNIALADKLLDAVVAWAQPEAQP